MQNRRALIIICELLTSLTSVYEYTYTRMIKVECQYGRQERPSARVRMRWEKRRRHWEGAKRKAEFGVVVRVVSTFAVVVSSDQTP